MGRNTRSARTASEENLAQADADFLSAEEEDQLATTTTTTTATAAAVTTTNATTAAAADTSSRRGRKASLSSSSPGGSPGTALMTTTTTTTTASTTGAVSAAAAATPSGPARRAPRVPPTHLPPDLPATAAEVTDLASLSKVVTLLSTIIVKAVYDGKSVTASNKRLIAVAAEETRRAMAVYQRLTSEPSAAPSATTATQAAAATATASASVSTPSPTHFTTSADVSASDELRRELTTCIKEVRMLRGDLSTATRAALSSAPTIVSTGPPARAPLSYAQAIGRTPPVTTPPQPQSPPQTTKPALLITTKIAVGTRQEAVEAFRKSISFREAKYAPSKVSPLSNNKLRVEFDSPRDCEDALRRLQSSPSSRVTAEPVKKLRPMLILKGISGDMPIEDLVEVVLAQNVELDIFTTDDMKLKFKRNNRNNKLYNAVFVASPQLFRAVVQMGRIRVDHQRVHAGEFSPFLQCHSCLQFGHVKRHCRSEQKRCAHCSDCSHVETDCPTKENTHIPAKCYNCATHNYKFPNKHNTLHNATSHSCPIFQLVRDKISRTIDYGV